MQTKYSIGADVMNTSELLQLYAAENRDFQEKKQHTSVEKDLGG